MSQLPLSISSLSQLPQWLSSQYANTPAVREGNTQLNFTDLNGHCRSVSQWFVEVLNLSAGDNVIVQMSNGAHYPVLLMSLWRVGLVPVCLTTSADITELERVSKLTNAKAFIACYTHPNLAELAVRRGHSLTTVSCSPEDFSSWFLFPLKRLWRHIRKRSPNLADFQFREAIVYHSSSLILSARTELDDVAMIQLTSATTGQAKAVQLSHRNLISNIGQLDQRLSEIGISGPQRLLMPLPIYHSYPSMICLMTWCQGGVVEMAADVKEINQIAELFDRFRPTLFAGVAPLFMGLVKHPLFPQLDFSMLKCTLSGGAPLNQAIGDQWQAITHCVISQGYGLTECSPVVTLDASGTFVTGAVGRPLEDTEVRIQDELGSELPKGSAGEICIRGPQVMLGYVAQAESNADRTWFRTGDIGRLEPDGSLHIIERQSDVIALEGNFKIYPSEVEALISQHPDITDCAFGSYQEEGETKLRLFVVTNNRRLTQKMIRNYCRQRLTAYKVPHLIELRRELPHSSVGRVLRSGLID
ncbi:MAG: AMP-binding protein [Marinobacterium sp.]